MPRFRFIQSQQHAKYTHTALTLAHRIPPPAITHTNKIYITSSTPHALHAPGIEPAAQILTLTDVEALEVATALDDGLDARARDAHAAAHRQVAELEKV
jgi:hypothetical protein